MLSLEQINEFERAYTRNMDTVLHWEQQVSKNSTHDEWIDIIHQRSHALHHIYLENQIHIKILMEGLKEELGEETREAVYEMLIRLFYSNLYDDAAIMLKIANALLPYYKKQQDIIHIIHLINVRNFMTAEYYYRQTRYPEQYHYQDLYEDLYPIFNLYKQLAVKERRILISSFYNMTCSHPMILPHEVNLALDIYDGYLAMIQDEEVIAMDKDDPNLKMRKESIANGIWNIAEIIEYFDTPHLLHFYDLIKTAYEEAMQKNETPVSYNLVSAYYYTCAYVKEHCGIATEIDWKSAYDYLIQAADILLKKLEAMYPLILDEAFFLEYYYPYQETTTYVFKIYRRIKDQLDTHFMREFVLRGTALICRLPKSESPMLVYAIHTEWCENALGALDDAEEQKILISNIIVKGQVQTYIHSQMVGLLADAILVHIFSRAPHLLLSLPQFSSIEEIHEKEDELRQFIHEAALFHDIGKNKISGIINQQSRALVDEEFALIKQHPEHPETGILKHSTHFTQYYDIIAGHHKSYDGTYGYPEYFDNVHSPNRILIDLITICDCLDSATDRLGRNYTSGKDITEVFLELLEGKHTRYNPDLVDLIIQDKELQDELTNIVNHGRDDVYYHTYKEYFASKS